MPRKLKVFRAHLGFYDTIVAAPSQKAALAAWGAGAHEFSLDFADITNDPKLIAAALAQPGVALKRQFGGKGAFRADPESLRAPKAHARSTAAAQKRKVRKQKETARKATRDALKKAAEEEARTLAALEAQEAELADKRRKLRASFSARKTALRKKLKN